ncbi:MAG: amidohydrolase [Firmicutes bacterium]|nr:amidohydrolase [Bacillota bacterium]
MQIIEDRRALHRIPELDRSLPKTMEYLRKALEGLNCQVFSPMESALCAWFDFGSDHAIAFRSDADALPIEEQTRLPFASCHPGRMHACGHDGHMAMLLELARRLSEKSRLPHNVLLIFQPAEETTGGAQSICATGIFKKYRVEAIFGIHLWPGLEEGKVFSRREEMMSRSCEVKVDIYGKPAHIARSEEGIDAMAAGIAFYRKVTAMEGALPKKAFRLLKFGLFQSGTVCNAISGHTHMEGSLRTFQDDVFYSLRAGIISVGKQVEASTGCTVSIYMNEGYPAVMNPGRLYDKMRSIVSFEELEKPSMITEDFSWYQKTIPGLFFFLGTGDTPALHSDDFNFNEDILEKGAGFFEEIAEAYR